MFTKPADKFLFKIIRRIGEDLRKAAAVTGIGFVGLILSNDDIGFNEALTLVVFGFISWVIGLYLEYLADKIESKLNHIEKRETKEVQ